MGGRTSNCAASARSGARNSAQVNNGKAVSGAVEAGTCTETSAQSNGSASNHVTAQKADSDTNKELT